MHQLAVCEIEWVAIMNVYCQGYIMLYPSQKSEHHLVNVKTVSGFSSITTYLNCPPVVKNHLKYIFKERKILCVVTNWRLFWKAKYLSHYQIPDSGKKILISFRQIHIWTNILKFFAHIYVVRVWSASGDIDYDYSLVRNTSG